MNDASQQQPNPLAGLEKLFVMKSSPRAAKLLTASLFIVAIGPPCYAQTTSFMGDVQARNSPNSVVGTNFATLSSGTAPSLLLVRSVNVWADTWWDWKMGTDNKLRLGFGSVPQLTMQNGAMGIGVDIPENRLHVGGDVRISRTSGSWGPNLVLDATKAGNGGIVWGFTSATSSDLAGAGKLAVVGNNIQRVVIDSNGNVGIGTTSPITTLDVKGSIRGSGAAYLEDKSTLGTFIDAGNSGFRGVFTCYTSPWGATNVGAMYGLSYDGSQSRWEFASGGAAYGGAFTFDMTSGAFILSNTGNNIGVNGADAQSFVTTRMVIDKQGNVGIGTSSPTQKLSVNGTVRAKEVVVETEGWSDYVLAADYTLQPLSDVERYIQDVGHLPGIPTEQEVAEKGVGLGEMQAKLLAKIEELTLHQIAQEKELRALKQEVATLRSREVQAKCHR